MTPQQEEQILLNPYLHFSDVTKEYPSPKGPVRRRVLLGDVAEIQVGVEKGLLFLLRCHATASANKRRRLARTSIRCFVTAFRRLL